MPEGRLGGDSLKGLLEVLIADRQVGRQLEQRRNWDIMRKSFDEQTRSRIKTALPDPIISEQVVRNLRKSPNVYADVVGKLAVVYKHGVRRIIGPDTGDEAANVAWATIERVTGQRTRSPTWNRRGWGLGPIWVYPTVRRGKPRFHQLNPHKMSIVRDPVTGEASAIGWRTGQKRDVIVIVDETSWRYYSTRGDLVRGPEGEREIVHGVTDVDNEGEPALPGAWMRFVDADDDDFWGVTRHTDLRDVTLYACLMMSLKSWIRNTQNRKLPIVKGQTEKIPKRQAMGGNAVFNIPMRNPGDVMVEIKDINSNIEQFHRDIAFEVERVVEPYGVPGHTVTYDLEGGTGEERLAIQHEALSQVRNEQIEFVGRFERRNTHVMSQVLANAAHPLARDLNPKLIAETFHLEVPPLTRVDDPIKIEEHRNLVRKRAAKSEIDFIQEDNPGMSREEATERMLRVVEDRSALATMLKENNLTMGPDGILTSPEMSGAMGTPAREANKLNGKDPNAATTSSDGSAGT